MNLVLPQHKRVLSGMRVTGRLHLGHLEGVLKNWLKLQHEFECFFFAADWHGLTTHYEHSEVIAENIWDMFIDWLAVGLNPGSACLFIQSWVPEHAELHLLLSMMTPLGWLERVPSYKDTQEKLKDKDLSTYGFLGYPVLQSADILIYRANYVPVGDDQVAHVEITREIARRFNHIYGREPDFENLATQALTKLQKRNAKLYSEFRKKYQETGDVESLSKAQALLETQPTLSLGDRERLLGYIAGYGRILLPEPEALLTIMPRLPGLDGQKMSKSYDNVIYLRETPENLDKKIRVMPTDPARVRRTDPGEPEKCPVWALHKVYSNEKEKDWVQTGCRSASIGCLDCKGVLRDNIEKVIAPIREAAKEYEENPTLLKNIVTEGSEQAREQAQETLKIVREAMGLEYT